MSLPTVAASCDLIRDGRPLIDVRAPVEFAAGALPGAVNLPLMDDEERHRVGLQYKQVGPESAVHLGHQLVSGGIKRARIRAWVEHIERHPDAILYCFRGGMRSQLSQQWLQEAGIERPRIEGGWKAMRQQLCQHIDERAEQAPMLLIGGLTGCAKTELIHALDNGIDLEGCARHKGSAFGRHPFPAPSQIDFEHRIAAEMLTLEDEAPTIMEDESRFIGSVNIPLATWRAMEQAPLIRVEMPLDWRIVQIQKDYIEGLWSTYSRHYGDFLGWTLMQRQLRQALLRLRKRLGSARLARLVRMQDIAFQEHKRGNPMAHEGWLAPLLSEYYDPMYRYQLEKHERTFLHVGDWDNSLAFAREWSANHRWQR
ncbi:MULTISPECIES: tRNA 2-selenouridine(34) synthase MnmH [unclassified Cobetia]|uniref:tRNA 2-selenouridine(34) synthase MnmH n=1 Tax=unclassified Cobetia TaxID=2609414 RepID=UPI0020969B28|nr:MULTISPECIES: tRNA 2-selenouridine(34) synthase MnmH [unclassified Cobetia]MCO7234095.1 tRNA 2-selenouridine(34) synthase MnmH [Cobetia sp. Dlab-2-AX]MCO7237357.1 tRNA 2-selenouridine(34) synthase MnmH [Cobetia sp. Dlab-2-U]